MYFVEQRTCRFDGGLKECCSGPLLERSLITFDCQPSSKFAMYACAHVYTRRRGFARLYYRARALHEAGQKHSIPLIKPGCVCHAMTL